jgi:hypothetical protein
MKLKLKEFINRKSEEVKNTEAVRLIISPDNMVKLYWDVFMTIILLYSCISTPAQIALY